MPDEQVERESRVAIELGTETHPKMIRFSTQVGRPSPFESYLLHTDDGWVLIDPEIPDNQASERLRQLVTGRPIATILTSDGHERSCYEVRKKWDIPVWGPVAGEGAREIAYEGKPDHMYKAGDTLPGGLTAMKLRGAWRGDHALFWRQSDAQVAVFTADLVNGQVEIDLARPDHYRRSEGIKFGSRPAYVERHDDPQGMKDSLLRLLEEDFNIICGAHGRPFRDNAKEALSKLIETL